MRPRPTCRTGSCSMRRPRFITIMVVFLGGCVNKEVHQVHAWLARLCRQHERRRAGRSLSIHHQIAHDHHLDDAASDWSKEPEEGPNDQHHYEREEQQRQIQLMQRALQRAHERDLTEFTSQRAPAWLRRPLSTSPLPSAYSNPTQQLVGNTDVDPGLPFRCTECGKCCQTQGSVYLSPDEIVQAAALCQVSVAGFIQTYASHTLLPPPPPPPPKPSLENQPHDQPKADEDNGGRWDDMWIRLKEKPMSWTPDEHKRSPPRDVVVSSMAEWPRVPATEPPSRPPSTGEEWTTMACIFLDPDTKKCQIYQARPVQCRTYPFWPSILTSMDAWNAECRRPGSTTTTSWVENVVSYKDDADGPSEPIRPGVPSEVQSEVTFVLPSGIHPNDSDDLPSWTPQTGGCEGMSRILAWGQQGAVVHSQALSYSRSTADAASQSSSRLSSPEDQVARVPLDTVLENLHEYILADRQFPYKGTELAVEEDA